MISNIFINTARQDNFRSPYRNRLVNLRLLRLSILEEVRGNLREQCIGQHIFILLAPLFTLFAKSIQLIRDQICRTAGDHFRSLAENLLRHLFVKRLPRRAVLTA